MMRAALLSFMTASAIAPAHAATTVVQIENAWVRPANAGQDAIPLYIDVTSDSPLTLVGAQSDVAKSAVLLVTDTSGERDVAKLVRSLDVAAGTKFRLAPRGPFIELRGITQLVRTGDSVAFTLEFKGADGKPVRASGQAVVRGIMPRPREYDLAEPEPVDAAPAK